MVLRKLRVLGIDRTAEAEETEIVQEALDLRLKEFHRLGALPWKITHTLADVALTANVATATGPTDMLYPITLQIRDDDNDYDVEIVDNALFQSIQTKSDTGTPEWAVFFGTSIRLYPVPDSSYTAKLTYHKILDDTAASTAPDVPVYMLRWLRDMVAYDVADDFRVTEQRVVRLKSEADIAERKIRALIPAYIEPQPVQAVYF